MKIEINSLWNYKTTGNSFKMWTVDFAYAHSFLQIEFRINGTRSNRLTLIVESKDMRSVKGSQLIDYYPDSELIVEDSQLRNNSRGIQIIHYNDPTDREGDVYIRRW